MCGITMGNFDLVALALGELAGLRTSSAGLVARSTRKGHVEMSKQIEDRNNV
jgi:hypothetical protein